MLTESNVISLKMLRFVLQNHGSLLAENAISLVPIASKLDLYFEIKLEGLSSEWTISPKKKWLQKEGNKASEHTF